MVISVCNYNFFQLSSESQWQSFYYNNMFSLLWYLTFRSCIKPIVKQQH